jgi:iron complex transport system ATP-binding protein
LSSAILCQNLACGYPDRTVLENINLEVGAGKVVALLGPNGSGKSTLLKSITGEIPLLSGTLSINERVSSELSARDRAKQVAFVPSEERTDFPFLVREIVALGRIPHSEGLFDSAEDKRITEEAMAQAECQHVADRAIMNVSAGERQRALIARALAQKAPILLLDEPTSHLDPGHQVSVVRLIRSLAENGLAVLVALHDLNLAVHLADEGVLLSNQRITSQGRIEDVLGDSRLDEAYGTSFERIKGSDGSIRLSPLFSTRV